MRRRTNGEGTYGTRTINGIEYKYYAAPNKEWTVYAKTASELKRKKAEKEQKLLNTTKNIIKTELTISDLCKKWLLSRKHEISAGTYDNYEDIMTAMIFKFKDYDLGNKQLQGLTSEMLESYLSALANHYSKNSIDRVWTIIKQSIEYGQENRLVPDRLNIKKIRRPNERNVAVKKKEVQFTTMDDMEILYNEANRMDDRGKPVYGNASKILFFIMYSGLRVSEAI